MGDAETMRSACAAVTALSAEIRERIRANCRNPFLPIWRGELRTALIEDFIDKSRSNTFPLWGAPAEVPRPYDAGSVAPDATFLKSFKSKLGLYGHSMHSRLFMSSVADACDRPDGTPWGVMPFRMVNAHRHYWPAWVGFIPEQEAHHRHWIP